jgi:Kef-type K+ transport system membrane component KefB/mannitol/fructose-specific phosphotransferase system IIA component (Ntr-type)
LITTLTNEVLQEAGELLTLALVILAGVFSGALARRIRLPGITGQILVGVVLGKAGFDLFTEESLHALRPITDFALGLMAVTVGAHLNIRRLRNAGRRLFLLLITEATVVPLMVFLAIWGVARESYGLAALFAASAIATAPATIVALVSEQHAKGTFVKTLVAAVALNNMACIFLFEVARASFRAVAVDGGSSMLAGPARQLVYAVLIGSVMALLMELCARYVIHDHHMATAGVVGVVLTSGIASYLDVSPLLACLLLGFCQTNITRTRDKLIDTVFADFQPVILAIFFTLAGLHLSFEHAAATGLVAFLLFFSRIIGKLASAEIAMRLAHATPNVRANLGMALIPQAGVAVGLVILLQDDPDFAHISDFFSAAVLTVVTASEIVGPIFTRLALNRAGESGKDRTRLIDFLQEEHIVTNFSAENKEQAIEKLVDLMIASHHLQVDRKQLLESVLLREAQASTCFGGGLAVPHGILPDGVPMVGVMGISRAGLAFETPDGRPVHCFVLLGTSSVERDRHLQVLATLAKTIGTDQVFQAQLFSARSPAHATDLLHGEESEDFNYFLEDHSSD